MANVLFDVKDCDASRLPVILLEHSEWISHISPPWLCVLTIKNLASTGKKGMTNFWK